MRHLVRFLVVFAALCATASSASAQIVWNVTYQDVTQSKTFGFNDSSSGLTRRQTVTAVTDYLNKVVDGRGTVNFDWEVSDTSTSTGTFAYAGTRFSWPTGQTTPVVGSVFRQAAGNITTGTPGYGRINFGYNWFATGSSGTGNPGSNQYDLYSVALHELTHGMHFAAVMNQDGSSEFSGGPYARYAQFLYKGSTGNSPLLNATGETFVGSASDTTSNDIYWGGTYGVAANGGSRFKIYAPSTFASGSSLSHLDESTFSNAVMSPQISSSETARTYSGREIGMLLDLGWNQFEWTGTTNGNWSSGASDVSTSRWQNSAIQGSNKAVRAPLGTITHNLVLHFGGSTAYTTTNDVAATFKLNRLILFGTASSASTIAGATNSKLQFGYDNNYSVTPQIEQRGTGAFNITSDIAIPNGLTVTDIGQTNPGQVNLGGVISGDGGLTKAGALTLRLHGSSANTYTGLTTVQAGTLLLNKTAGQNAMAGSLTITKGTVELGAANQLPSSGTTTPVVTLAGGTLKTGSGTGNSDVVGAFEMTSASTIALGTGGHILQFTGFKDDSLSGVLTITGWAGSVDSAGTSGRILVSGVSSDPNSTYAGWLGTVAFQNFETGATFITTGTSQTYELVPHPVPEPATVLAVAFGALGLGALVRRRRRVSTGEAAIAP